MTRRVPDRHIADVARAFRNYPESARADLIATWPDLYFAVSRLVARHEVAEKPRKIVRRGSLTIARVPKGWECAHAIRKYVGQDDTHMFWRCLHCPDMKAEAKR